MTSVPWAGRRHSFAGWVPNIHSHLSFSLIGVGRGPEVTPMTPSYSGRLRRFVCVMQRRETDDFLAPAGWSRRWRPEATQHFVMVGSTEEVQTPVGLETPPIVGSGRFSGLRARLRLPASANHSPVVPGRDRVKTAPDAQGMLRGRIHVMFWQSDPEAASRQDALILTLKNRIGAGDGSRDTPRTDDELDELPDQIAADVGAGSDNAVTLRFALFRTGEIRIWYDDADGDRLPAADRIELAKQSYFFVKDMVHHHVHHDPKSDQITPLTNVGGQGMSEGEEHWRRDTAWSLSRAVDALARRGKLQDLREATGILAYADAFQKTLLLYRRRADDPSAFEANTVTYRYDYAHIRESLRVQLEQVTARRTIRGQMIVAGLAGSIAATSLLASLISAHNGAIGAKIAGGRAVLPGIGDTTLQMLADRPLIPTVFFGALLWFISEHFLSEDRIGAKRARSRKAAQSVRGILNSLARRRPATRDGAWVQRWIERLYLMLAAVLLLAMVLLAPRVATLGRHAEAAFTTWMSERPAPEETGRTKTAGGDLRPPTPQVPAPSPSPTRSVATQARDRPQARGRDPVVTGKRTGGEPAEASRRDRPTAAATAATPAPPPAR